MLKRSDFLRNVSTLVGGTAAAQILMVAATPLLTRLFGPAQYGELAVFSAWVAVVSVVAAGRYQLAILLPDSRRDADSVVAVALLFGLGLTGALVIVLAIWHFGSRTWGFPMLPWWGLVMPASVLAFACQYAFAGTLQRGGRFLELAVGKLSQTVGTIAVALALSFVCASKALVLAAASGHALCAMTLAWFGLRGRDAPRWPTSTEVIQAARRYREFPTHSAPAAVLDTASLQAPTLFVANTAGREIVGHFGLASMVVSLPAAFIGQAIGQVLMPRLAAERNAGRMIGPLLLRTAGLLAVLGGSFALFLVLFAPELFALAFGEEWRRGGEFAQILAPAFAVRFVVSPLSVTMSVSGHLRQAAAWQAGYFCTILLTLWAASRLPIKGFLVAFAVHETVQYLIYLKLIMSSARKADADVRNRWNSISTR